MELLALSATPSYVPVMSVVSSNTLQHPGDSPASRKAIAYIVSVLMARAGYMSKRAILEPILRELPRKGWLFPRHDGQLGPIRAHTVSHLANRHLHRIGIDLTFHSLRHRFGTQVYRVSGRDLRQTQELMRHRSPVSTAIYTEVDQGEAYGVVSALPG